MSELTLWDELRQCVVNKESFTGTQELRLSADIIALARMHMVEE